MFRRRLSAFIAAIAVAMTSFLTAYPQFAIKSNILYDATTTPNIGMEVATSSKNTFNVVYGLNPWNFGDGKKLKHWVLQPEYRWWMCSAFNGHFIGVHAMGGQFNAAKVDIPVPGFFFSGDNLRSGVKDARYQGAFAGAGFTYGYQWIISRHLNFEAEIGAGYNHVWYKKYPCTECGTMLKKGGTNYFGLTKIGLSLLYLF